ncbi:MULTISPECIES: DoxX family protein [unclassified Paraflavitalea]|uniref:DoxX family protein n=1 Tax=unclassified Paraflavitalea TaxID=2798305 RepID=UPI003D343A6A
MKKLFSTAPFQFERGIAVMRIITGLLMLYHGKDIFDSKLMHEYATWDTVKTFPAPLFMAYLAKGLEFVNGLLLAVGLLTRLNALSMAAVMLIICFKIGNGKFYYEDQHPFLFAMIAIMFIFTGPGSWSIDEAIEKRLNKN